MKKFLNKHISNNLQIELFNEIKNEYTIDNDNLLTSIIEDVINEHYSSISFTHKKSKYISRRMICTDNKCKARLWNNHISSQCSNAITDGEYCNIHNKMILKNNKLRFGRIDEPIPEYDNYTYNKLYWYNL